MHNSNLSIKVVAELVSGRRWRLSDLTDETGIYALADHAGELKYIGMTDTSFRDRITQKHVTGSENYSHMFSKMYNVGRMWRARNQPGDEVADAKLSKKVRTLFIRQNCRAVIVPMTLSRRELLGLEKEVIANAPRCMTEWNQNSSIRLREPRELVDQTINALQYTTGQIEAVARQEIRSKRFV